MLIRVLDFETTGVPTRDTTEAICEVGWCDVVFYRDDAEILTPVSHLVNPGRPIPPAARAVHHISDADVESAISPMEACKLLMDGKPDYFCAHNIDFEREFFGGGETPWICTYKSALRIWPDVAGHKNQELRYILDIDNDDDFDIEYMQRPHRAADDAYVTAFILRRLLGNASIEDLARWSKGPALLYMCYLKKHRNTPWHEVPADYLRWVVDNITDDRDVRATANYWLRKKTENAQSTGVSNVR